MADAIFCEQYEDGVVIFPSSEDELRGRLEEQGWASYGTGVTPLAEENAKRRHFACRRCTNELIEQRLNRGRDRAPGQKLSTAQQAVAPDANRCFTVLQEPCFIASRLAPVNCRTLGDEGMGRPPHRES